MMRKLYLLLFFLSISHISFAHESHFTRKGICGYTGNAVQFQDPILVRYSPSGPFQTTVDMDVFHDNELSNSMTLAMNVTIDKKDQDLLFKCGFDLSQFSNTDAGDTNRIIIEYLGTTRGQLKKIISIIIPNKTLSESQIKETNEMILEKIRNTVWAFSEEAIKLGDNILSTKDVNPFPWSEKFICNEVQSPATGITNIGENEFLVGQIYGICNYKQNELLVPFILEGHILIDTQNGFHKSGQLCLYTTVSVDGELHTTNVNISIQSEYK